MFEFIMQQIDRLRGDVDQIKEEIDGTDREVIKMSDDVEAIKREAEQAKKVQDYQGVEIENINSKIAALQEAVAKWKSKSHGNAIAAGKAKKKNRDLRAEIDKPKPN